MTRDNQRREPVERAALLAADEGRSQEGQPLSLWRCLVRPHLVIVSLAPVEDLTEFHLTHHGSRSCHVLVAHRR